MKKLSHIDAKGNARMVDVSSKPESLREARARGYVYMGAKTMRLIAEGMLPKGDVFAVARVAGIMAAKRTSDIIPLCHPIPISSIEIDIKPQKSRKRLLIESRVVTTARTGVEMEALTAVSAAGLAIYDMCKSVDRDMVISEIMLLEKKGGTRGHYRRPGK